MILEEWSILGDNGNIAITFDTFIDIDIINQGEALNFPIEKGSFAAYNKVESPLEIVVTLGKQGLASDQDDVLKQLDDLQQETSVLSIVTPATLYANFTLESYSYARKVTGGARLLVVEIRFKEVREVETRVYTTNLPPYKTKNPSSSSSSSTGKAKTDEVDTTIIEDIRNTIGGYLDR